MNPLHNPFEVVATAPFLINLHSKPLMLYKVYFLLLFISVFVSVNAQKAKSPAAKVNAASASNLQLQKKLDSIFSSYNKSTPGIAVTVLKQGKVIAKKAYGMASLELKVPFSHNTLVRIGYSEGREFFAISALVLLNGLGAV